MALALRHKSDPSTSLASLAGLMVHRETDAAYVATIMGRPLEQIEQRFAAGHRVYLATRDGVAAAWGWVATRSARIGEVDATLTLPTAHRYLWNFVTLREQRGLGIYPRLLEAIMNEEAQEASWFWIAYAPENHASASGITRAGFAIVAELSFDGSGRTAFHEMLPGSGPIVRRLLGVPEAAGALSPCWKCVRAGRPGMQCADGACCCDYQRPEISCAA